MPIPREHGAWGMLYSPFLIALFVLGSFDFRVILLFVVITAVFFAHEPVLRLARIRSTAPDAMLRTKQAKNWFFIYIGIALFSGGSLILFYRLWLLMIFGILSLAALWTHFQFLRRKSERSIFAEVMSVAGLTASAPALCYAVTGSWTTMATILWILCSLYFISSIFYLKSIVSRFSKKGDAARLARDCILYHVVLIIFIGSFIVGRLIPPVLGLAFVPILIRTTCGMLLPTKRLNLRRVGFAEFGLTLLFLAIVSLSFN